MNDVSKDGIVYFALLNTGAIFAGLTVFFLSSNPFAAVMTTFAIIFLGTAAPLLR